MNKQLKRIKNRTLSVLSAVSIVLCGIFLILWPLSYATGVQLSIRNGAGSRLALVTLPNEVGLVIVHGEPRASSELDLCTKSFHVGSGATGGNDKLRWFWQKPGRGTVGFASNDGQQTIHFDEINNELTCNYFGHFAPIWLLPIITFVGPMWWWLSRKRLQFRQEHGLCVYCGGDMSASPYRCPTCGKEPAW